MRVIVFNTWQYAIFLPVVLLLYFALPHKFRWVLLLGASYYFYMSWNPELIVLILFTTCTSFFSALAMERIAKTPKQRKLILFLGVSSSLLCLFFFKYFNFFSQSVNDLLRILGLPVSGITLQLMLPVGISFYTFQTLSYVIDVYRGDMPAQTHFGIYAVYVSFFPQLVAGPIERATNLLPQFYEEHTFETAQASEGLRMILLGLYKKVLVADVVAPYVNTVYNNVTGFSGLSIIVATLLFAVQIYCDFSGYSDIAVGSAKIMGFQLMENFRSPYLSKSVKEFWRRWHISLSTWFSDYVYIPLGGNRVSPSRHLLNLFITFLLSGLWHGAAWNFLLWGALHGIFLIAEVFLLPRREKRFAACKSSAGKAFLNIWWWGITMLIVLAGWMLFRANSLADSVSLFSHVFRGLNPLRLAEYLLPIGLSFESLLCILALISFLAIYEWMNRDGQGMRRFTALPPAVRYTVYYAIGFLLIFRCLSMPAGLQAEFIYFQF